MAPDGRLAAMARVDGGRLHPEKVLIGPTPVAVAGGTLTAVHRVIHDIDHLQPGLRFVATVGVFEWRRHLGHVHVLERLQALAEELRAVPVAITFEPHPQAVITGRAPDLICDPREKLTLMADAGAEVIVVQRFDEAFRSQTAEQFLDRLARGRELVGLVMSHEFAFGRDRQGTVETVQRLAARDAWRLVEVDTLEVDGAPVSSSRIRAAVTAGHLAAAERMLGRPYRVPGDLGLDGVFQPTGIVRRRVPRSLSRARRRTPGDRDDRRRRAASSSRETSDRVVWKPSSRSRPLASSWAGASARQTGLLTGPGGPFRTPAPTLPRN